MRKKALLLIGLSVLIVFGIGITTSVLIMNVPDDNIIEPKLYIAIDDIMVVQYSIDNWSSYIEQVDNSEILKEGYHIPTGYTIENWIYSNEREFYRIWIQFNLTEKPKIWSTCVLQVYISTIFDTYHRGKYGFRVYVNSSWSETMEYDEFKIKQGQFVDWDFMNEDMVYVKKIITYDLSEYIENSYSITINFYIQNAHLGDKDYLNDMYFEIYSKDSNVDEEYLPQLIWS